MNEMASRTVAARPGGRTAETSRRIFEATLELLVEDGIAACGFQAVAERADVARATLYRRWNSRAALVADALASRLESFIPTPDTGTLAGDLAALLNGLGVFLQTGLGRAAIAASAELAGDADSERANFWRARLSSVAPILERAATRGELPADADRDALLACAAGALYFRLLITAQPVDRDWSQRAVMQVLRGVRR